MKKWAMLLATAGFVGAGIFYSPYIGFNGQTLWVCPICPYIDAIGNPKLHFVEFSLGMGLFNAILFIAVGLSIRAIARFVSSRIRMRDGRRTG